MSKYSVQISGKDLSIAHSVNRSLADKIAMMLISERVSKAIPTTNTNKALNDDTTTSNIEEPSARFSDFIDTHGVTCSGELVTSLGLFLDGRGKLTFTKDEYRAYFKMLRGKLPTNVPRDFSNALDNKWISEDSEDQFKVTSLGEKMVNDKLN
ncbi:MAG: hypothetical protein HRU25_15885 [Psychrobium sp.]|nr:hypothetical protein [Psychrobium sp.]